MSPADTDIPSTRPYLIRALHEWCSDNGFSPYIAVQVDASVQVPMEFVKNGEIVLNVGVDATSSMRLGNDFIEFKARFGGVPQTISIPVGRVHAIYARENGQGMAFPIENDGAVVANPGDELTESGPDESGALTLVEPGADTGSGDASASSETQDAKAVTSKAGKRPTLTRIK